MTELTRRPKESTARFNQRVRVNNRLRFSEWRKAKGLSYQDIVDELNIKAGMPVAKYPTVVSWGTRGASPAKALSEVIKATWEDCPIV